MYYPIGPQKHPPVMGGVLGRETEKSFCERGDPESFDEMIVDGKVSIDRIIPMGSLNVNDIKPDMVLAQAITNFQGVMLLPKGAKLTERHISLMKSWGVTGAEIEGESMKEKNEIGGLKEEEQKLIEERIKERFPHEASDPINAELQRIAVKVMISNLKKDD